jgi:hypothetical protein
MYYYVYKITNLINGKIYVGKHKSPQHPSENGYYGSGRQIIAAVKKYGVENFNKEVLHYCSSLEEMSDKEAEIVTEDFVKRSDTYNMHKGGPGGWDHYNGSQRHKEKSRLGGLISGYRASNPFYDPEWQKKYNCMNNPEHVKTLCEKANTPESLAKKRETWKRTKHQQGANNSQYGRIWISNIDTKEVRRILMSEQIPDGWVRGKKGHSPKKLWMNNGSIEHYILTINENEYTIKGFNRGRLKTSMPQNK